MPLPKEILDELDAKHRGESEAAARATFWAYVRIGAECLFWCAIGLACIGWSFHMTRPTTGWIVFWLGLLLGNGGIAASLLMGYRRGEARGDW